MVTLSFNHIQGKNGSHWNRLMREEKAKEYCIVAKKRVPVQETNTIV